MSPPSVASGKTLWLLTGLVLLTHLLVLRAAATALLPATPNETPVRAFMTRSIELVPTRSMPAPAPVPIRRNPGTAAAQPATEQIQTATDPLDANLDAAPPKDNEAAVRDTAALQAPQIDAAAATPDELAPAVDELALAPAHPPRQPVQTPNIESVARPVRLIYAVETNKFPYSLNAELLWQVQGENYAARLTVGAFGQARVQTSRGTVNARGLAPLRFSDKYRSEVAAHFNYPKRKVTFSANTPDAPLLNGAQDRLSVLIQLGSMVANARSRYAKASTITIQTIGPRDADNWLFTVGDEETVSLPNGELVALKLTRNPRREFDQKVELWLAPALDFLPARLRITESNGDFIDQKWLSSEATDELLSWRLLQPALEISQCKANCTLTTIKG